MKTLLKERDIDEEIKISCPGEIKITNLKTDYSLGILLNTFMLSLKVEKLWYILQAMPQRNI